MCPGTLSSKDLLTNRLAARLEGRLSVLTVFKEWTMFKWVKTAMLMASITALFILIGGMIGGSRGIMVALLFALATNFFSYWYSDKIVLRIYNAQEVDETTAPQFYRMVRELATRANLPMPRVYLIDETAPNAFATGRDPEHAAVAATSGILRVLSEREMRGVMAHELAHVKHRDILISTISATMAGAISALANFAMFFGGHDENDRPSNPIADIAVALLTPIAGALIQMAISRAREFEADRGGAQISGDPQAIATALDKIHRYPVGIPFATAEAHPATAQMMIINPLAGGGLQNLFSTHPATEERIERLMEMAHTGRFE
ncbi:MAG: Protease HtpX [Burkholderia gladioli]|nr:MAG: Protease HtpX [Burkholderia gladioli]